MGVLSILLSAGCLSLLVSAALSQDTPDSRLLAQSSPGNQTASQGQTCDPQKRPGDLMNPVAPAGIYSSSQGHQHGLITRALGGVVSGTAQATLGLVGAALYNQQSVDLPPSIDSNAEWPFKEPHRDAVFVVDWVDGSTAKASRLPDGSFQILGSGRRFIMQPQGDGNFAMFGDYGSMASVTRRPGGGFTILKADGSVEQVLPREGGGFTVTGAHGVIATILPGVAGGKKHIIRGSACSSAFLP